MLSRPHQDEAFTKLLFFADKADLLWYGRPMDSADEGVVFRMGSNPEPEHSVGSLNADGPIVQAHASRPEPSDLLEVKRWMSWIALEEGEAAICKLSYRIRQGVIANPKGRRSVVDQSCVDRLAA